MPIDLFGDLFLLCLDLNPKSSAEGRMESVSTHYETSHHGHGFEYMDWLTRLVALIDHIGQRLAR